MATDTVGTIFDIISSNLYASNIRSAEERLECARIIADVIGRNPVMEAPRNGVLLHYSKGNGVTELVIKTDPPVERSEAIALALKTLADTLGNGP